MKLSKLIIALEELHKSLKDEEVLISSDEEGNQYGKLGKVLSYDLTKHGIVIFPQEKVYPD